jgi:GDP-4-dehydro-6-deoxy-D-mannose reductase
MRAFVTGGHGFVGTWLLRHLSDAGDSIVAPHATELDVLDGDGMAKAVSDAAPDVVYHLAGFAHVGQSWERPDETFNVNALGTLHVLEAARLCAGAVPRVVVVSSAEVYGKVAPDDLPLTEASPVRPVSPYAASKAAAEVLAVQSFLGRGVPVVVARPFNHAGPGQSPDFVVAAFARRIVEARGSGASSLVVGNLSTRRDITDVRDVVRAYRLLAESGEPGETYNICSGTDVVIEDLVRLMCILAGVPELALEVDPSLLRPADVPVLRGDPSKLMAATGWLPEVPLDQTLADTLADV